MGKLGAREKMRRKRWEKLFPPSCFFPHSPFFFTMDTKLLAPTAKQGESSRSNPCKAADLLLIRQPYFLASLVNHRPHPECRLIGFCYRVPPLPEKHALFGARSVTTNDTR